MLSYRRFLGQIHSELATCISDAENMEWHHSEASSAPGAHYRRLLTAMALVEERIRWYNDNSGTKKVLYPAIE